jgi:hypothetical protein
VITGILQTALLISGCRKEPAPELLQHEELVQVEFKFGMPVQQVLRTYAITTYDENVISQVMLLAFKVSGVDETFEYYRAGMQIFSGSAVNEKSFYTKLPKSEDTFRFVLIVNGGNDLADAVRNLPAGTPKAEVMDDLVMDIAGKWNAGSSANFDPLPMWSESAEVAGIEAQTVLPSVRLLRSLARLDILLSGDALAHFKLTSVNIYNANNKVRMAPLPANFDEGTSLVNAPSIPAGTSASLHIEYDGYASLTAIEREIYIPEASAGITRVVVGGMFDADLNETFYEAVLNTDILRNNRYIINITKVNASGELLPEDALSSAFIPERLTENEYRISSRSLKDTGSLNYTLSVIPEHYGDSRLK